MDDMILAFYLIIMEVCDFVIVVGSLASLKTIHFGLHQKMELKNGMIYIMLTLIGWMLLGITECYSCS
ncbi:MAG: hypothetical protein EBX50_20465 [Chitinophagia bacterium]|nr:hypothetical protein [Chitinophagia bacterium]